MTKTKTKITFEIENKEHTSVKIMRDNKLIGRVWSENQGDSSLKLPYPHNDSDYCRNAVQICGFNRISETWSCGVFEGTKDCVISFTPDNEYYNKKRKKYFEYVKGFMQQDIKKIKTGASEDYYCDLKEKENKPIETMMSFEDFCLHNL